MYVSIVSHHAWKRLLETRNRYREKTLVILIGSSWIVKKKFFFLRFGSYVDYA